MSSLRGSGMRTIFEHPPECGRKDTRGYWLRREAGGVGEGMEENPPEICISNREMRCAPDTM